MRKARVVLEKNAGNSFSILDETAGLYVECSADLLSKFKSHDLIEVEGVSNPGKFAPYLDARSVRKLGNGTVPAPQIASRDDLLSGQMDAQWIEVSGVIRRAEPGWHVLDVEVDLEAGKVRVMGSRHWGHVIQCGISRAS